MRLAKAVWFILFFVLLALVAGVVWVMTSNYVELTDFAIQQLQRPDLRVLIEGRYFTLDKYARLQRAGFSAIPILLALTGLLFIKRKNTIEGIAMIFSKGKQFAHNVSSSIKESNKTIQITLAAILTLVLIRSVYYALHFYPQYDECWNYNYFLSNNFFTTFFAYNNYPLHNIVTYLFLKVLPDSTFVMRLPNILLGLINIILVFYLNKRIFNHDKLALISAALFAVLPTAVFYMLFARGVMFALFFVLLLLYFFLVKRIDAWSKTDRIIVSILGALGCYSMISFPVFLVIIFFVYGLHSLLDKNIVAIKKIGWVTLGIIIGTGVLYLPMFLASGMSLVTDSPYDISNFNWNNLLKKVHEVSRNQIGFHSGAYVFLGFNLLLFFISPRKKIMALNILLILLPFLVILIFKTHLPARAIGFQVFAYLFTMILMLEYILKKSNSYILLATSLLTVIGFNYISTTHTFFDWSGRPDKGIFEIAQLMQDQNITSYYDFDGRFSYFVPGILYHHKINGKKIEFKTSNKKSARYLPIENYKGDVFVADFANLHTKEIGKTLHLYQDESNQFILFRRASKAERAAYPE